MYVSRANEQGQLLISTKSCIHSNSATFIIVLHHTLKAAVYLVNNEEIGVQLHDNESKIELNQRDKCHFHSISSLPFPYPTHFSLQ